MGKYQHIAQLGLAVILFLSTPAAYSQGTKQLPNILLILADDMGINDLGRINHGETRTPNLDQLAASGISFSRHYTESSCSPSRAALLTGMNPARVGFHPTGLGLPNDITTLPEFLRQQGYHTALFGKWHVGELLSYDGPDKHGFDEWFGMLSHFYLAGVQRNGHLIGQGPVYIDPWLQLNGAAPTQYKGHIDDLLTERVVKTIAEKSAKPWFIYAPFLSPHTPTIPNKEFAAKYPDTPNGRYRAVVEQLDNNIGRVLKQVEASGLADNTIVIFVSDNGGTGSAFPSNAPLSGKKATYAEGGIRTPLIVHWPKHWSGGKRVDDVKYIADIYPTLVKALGLKADAHLDGEDLFKQRKKPLFWYSQNLWEDSYSVLSANGEWRLQGSNTSTELFRYADKLALPEATQNPTMQAKLVQEYISWRDAATRLPNSSQPNVRSNSKAIANAFRPTFSLGLSFSLPAAPSDKPVQLVSNKQFDLSYAAGEFILTLDSHTLKYPYQLHRQCNSIYLNFNITQDNTIFYGQGVSAVDLYVNDNKPIAGNLKTDRINSDNFSLLTLRDFNTQPRGVIAERSITMSTRFLTQPELAPALDALNRDYCPHPKH